MSKKINEIEENILKTEYSEVMQQSYIDYAMSVIISRALPDVRDGLKPVQRRTLYDMYELGIRYDRPHRKSARIVGDTMGKYHPHGDSSIYDSLVVMTQGFKKSIPLVDGHGNFGNIEGDGAAAMRYTEARLEQVAQDTLLADLDKDVVDFVPNFDETETEPEVLPSKLPLLLINGAEGIAVGMATNIPPHNLGETIDALKAFMNNEHITTSELMQYVKGPDFPTGGIVINKNELLSIYETGSGKLKVRGKVSIEKGKSSRINVVISEIPYTMIGANISKFLQDVASLANNKVTGDILDISNQISKEGIRIVFELRKDADTDNFINMLYRKTRLEDTFGVNMLAIVNGKPETMGLKGILRECADYQFEITGRKYRSLLAKEIDKKEIQEGLIKACNVIDLIIEILRGSKDRDMARRCLVEGITTGIKFKRPESKAMATSLSFSLRQANAILEMRLYKLIGLEIEALINEHEDTIANIYRYEDILERKESMMQVIINELNDYKDRYSKSRRTLIENAEVAIFKDNEVKEMDVVFLMDRFGYAKTIEESTYERNKDAIHSENRYVLKCSNIGRLCLFTDKGNLHTIKVMDLPFGKFRDKGIPIDNVCNYSSSNELCIFITDQSTINLYRLAFVTRQGLMKIVDGGEFDVMKRTVIATKLAKDDEIVSVMAIKEQRYIILHSKNGYWLKMSIEDVPEKKKNAIGVRGIRLGSGDSIDNVYYTNNTTIQSVECMGKEIILNQLKLGKRDTRGTKIRL